MLYICYTMKHKRIAKLQRPRKTEQINVRLAPELLDQMRDIAEKEMRPLGQIARMAVVEFLKRKQAPEAAA